MPPPYSGPHANAAADRAHQALDRRGREVGDALGLRAAEAAGTARCERHRLGAQSDRQLRSGAAGEGRSEAFARSRQSHAAPPRHLRSDRTAAHAGRGGCLPRDKSPDAYEKRVDALLNVAALRRAHGHAVARPGALRRYARLSHRQPSRDVALARLGDRRVQPQHAVRRVHHRAARRRPAAAMPTVEQRDRHRIQPQPHDQFRRRRDSGGVSERIRGGSRGDHVGGVAGHDHGLRALPRS